MVCQGYLAPDKLDEKFLDPKHVFKEIQEDTKIRLNILKPEVRCFGIVQTLLKSMQESAI